LVQAYKTSGRFWLAREFVPGGTRGKLTAGKPEGGAIDKFSGRGDVAFANASCAAADETALRLWFSVLSFECSVVAAAVRGVAGGAAGDVCGTVVVPSEGG